MVDIHEKSRETAAKRALRFLRLWRGGKSYKRLSKEFNLSVGRVRVLVRRGKQEEVKGTNNGGDK